MTTEHVSRLLACGGSSMSSPTRHFRKPHSSYPESILSVCGYGFPDVQLHIRARALRPGMTAEEEG
jgi:hypothetical protein